MGAYVHSHGVHFFALAAPDLVLGINAPPAQRNIVGLVQAAPEVATKALRLRSIGQKIVELIGGRGTHPVAAIPGGMASPLDADARDALKKLVDEAVPLGVELFKFAKGALVAKMDLVTSLPLESHAFEALEDSELLAFCHGPRAGMDYEKDTYRLECPLIPKTP